MKVVIMLLMTYLQKSVNVKVFNITARINKAKTLVKHTSCDCNCKFNSKTCNSDQKWNNETSQCECKSYYTYKEDCNWNPSTCVCENSKYFKSTADD